MATVTLVLAAGCSSGTASVPTVVPDAAPAVTAAASSAGPTTTTSTSTTTSTTTSSRAPSTSSTVPRPTDFLGEETIGASVQGRPITVLHRGTVGGKVILVVGVIHGDEDAALPIVDRLATMPLPAGIDLWLMPRMNPDGQANRVRGNGHGVDLNRNFPHDWQPIAEAGNWEWSGTGPASEPETQAFIAFASRIHPTLTLWYHQDLNIISPTKGKDGPLRKRYAQLTGMPMGGISGGIYHGVAATWVRLKVPNAMSFIIELGATLSRQQALVHADAVVAIIQMI